MNEEIMNFDLDEEEQEILDAFEQGKIQFEPVSDKILAAARETLKKGKNINIRINESDLTSIKLLAAREGMPYQTLIGSLIHKYATGELKHVA
jgi:predicted DNA binding CopG/RHH family protein